MATGAGRAAVSFAHRQMSEVTADARGAVLLNPPTRTILDIGAEEARAIRCDAQGRALDLLSTRNAPPARVPSWSPWLSPGGFPGRAGHPLPSGSHTVAMNAQCAVFAESEVISLLHANTPLPDIAEAIFGAIANRAVALGRRVGITPPLVLAGGLARNPGFVAALRALPGGRRRDGAAQLTGIHRRYRGGNGTGELKEGPRVDHRVLALAGNTPGPRPIWTGVAPGSFRPGLTWAASAVRP